ncbi:MAG: hypothetical protein FWB99_06340 [Treponema sp.]|nr:hypothetical protein [Treponema sp.]MCL2232680.1 hypothetical protein [Treponema sp.]
MNKRVNFEDSLFILMMRLRMIQDIITLDADPEFFLEKTLDDIYFIDRILKILLGSLQENHFLIERAELLEHLADLELQFSRVLKNLLDHDGNISIRTAPSKGEKVTACRNNSLERQKVIAELSPAGAGKTVSPIVSSDELTELLKAF